ncbi:MAG: PilZ domain-containing protein [Planctomycetota bacterium]
MSDLDVPVVRSTRLWMGRQRWDQVVAEADPATAGRRRKLHLRRREPRHPYRVSCLVRIGEDGNLGVYSVDTCNLSRHGLGFRHDRLLDPDTHCLIALRDSSSNVTLHAARVRWCAPIEPVGFDTGLEFEEPINVSVLIPG